MGGFPLDCDPIRPRGKHEAEGRFPPLQLLSHLSILQKFGIKLPPWEGISTLFGRLPNLSRSLVFRRDSVQSNISRNQFMNWLVTVRTVWLAMTAVLLASSVQAQWLASSQSEGLAYFLQASPARWERYDLTNGHWLPPIPLPSIHDEPTAGFVDADGIYVAYGRSVFRYNRDGGDETHLANTTQEVTALIANRDYLYFTVQWSGEVTSISKSQNTFAATGNAFYTMEGLSISASGTHLFGRSSNVSPSDIVMLELKPDGTFGLQMDSPHHGEYPYAFMTWVFPDDGRVVDSAGIVYNALTLRYVASFGGTISDLQFHGGDIPIVLRGSEIIAYTSGLLPVGSTNLGFSPNKIYLTESNVVAFTGDGSQDSGIRADIIGLMNLNAPKPGEPVDPRGVLYEPDAQFIGRDNILYLLSTAHQSLFRWDATDQIYLESIPLLGIPEFVAYSAPTHTVYLAYASGLIRKIDLDDPTIAEVPFATLPDRVLGLATAGEYLFAVDPSGAWGTHYTFDSTGRQVDSVDWNYWSREYIWSEANQKMYFFRDDSSPNDLLWEEINADGIRYPGLVQGGIGRYQDSPLHDSTGFTHPIRVAPDGSVVLLGSGAIHNATTLARLPAALPNQVTDATWLAGELKTVRAIGGVSQYQAWTGITYAQRIVRQYPGNPYALVAGEDGPMVGISIVGGRPSFYVLDGDFNIVPPPILAAPQQLSAAIASADEVELRWSDVSGEAFYLIERRLGTNDFWTQIGSNSVSVITFTDRQVTFGNTYSYRVVAGNNVLRSGASQETAVALVEPAAPDTLSATGISPHQIRITWTDVAFEAGYTLERRQGDAGSWIVVATLGADITSHVDEGLQQDTTYSYRLRSYNGIGSSETSASASATTLISPPTPPSYLWVNSFSPFFAYLSWPGDGVASSFVIERQELVAGRWTVLETLGGDIRNFADNTTAASTTYIYRIKAINRLGESDYTESDQVTTPPLRPPDPPAQLQVRAISSSEIRIMWRDGVGEDGYSIERQSGDSEEWHRVATIAANSILHLDAGLTEGTEYTYRIQAFNAAGASLYVYGNPAVPTHLVSLLPESFDPGINPLVWAQLSGVLVTNGNGFFEGNGLWFGMAGKREAMTEPVDVSQGGYLEFQYRAGNESPGTGGMWDGPESDESLTVEFSIDGGVRWEPVAWLDRNGPNDTNWNLFSLEIPQQARTDRTQFRWRQNSHNGTLADIWALDDVSVTGAAPPLPLPPTFIIASGNGATTVSVLWLGSSGATSYLVERREALTEWALVAHVPARINYFTDNNAMPNRHYTYRIKAVNPGGEASYSPTATARTWTQWQDWVSEHYGSPDVLGEEAMTMIDMDGVPLMIKFAYNLPPRQPMTTLQPGGNSGLPSITFDSARNRLVMEFIRRRHVSKPGISYRAAFTESLQSWNSDGVGISSTPIDNIWERVRCEDFVTVDATIARFGKVTVSRD